MTHISVRVIQLDTYDLTSVDTQGIYPTIILLLVAFKKTIWDSFSDSDIRATLPGIQFRSVPGAVEDSENATDHPPSFK